MSMPAMTAFTQLPLLMHLSGSLPLPRPTTATAPTEPPTPCPKERALFGASNKSQNGDVAHNGPRFSIRISPYPHKCASFSSPCRPVLSPACAGGRALDTRDQPVHI